MDYDQLKAQFEASRRVEVPVGDAVFHLLMPTDYAWRVALEAHRDPHGRLLEAQAFRGLLETAVVGWTGVKTSDVMPGVGNDPLPHSAGAVQLLLDVRQDVADALTVALAVKLRERREAREGTAKNS